MEASIPIKLRSYRAFKYPWVGSPSAPPDIYSDTITVDDDILTVIYVSWNGDTRTNCWEFHTVDDGGKIQRLGSQQREGFETRFEHNGFAGRVLAKAFDAEGNGLGQSVVCTTPEPLDRTKAGSQNGHFAEAEMEHASSSSSVDPAFHIWDRTFLFGLACGTAVIALLWAGMSLYKNRWTGSVHKRQHTKYMPLKELDETIDD